MSLWRLNSCFSKLKSEFVSHARNNNQKNLCKKIICNILGSEVTIKKPVGRVKKMTSFQNKKDRYLKITLNLGKIFSAQLQHNLLMIRANTKEIK